MTFSMGTDPEFFLNWKGLPVSAHSFVPGTKSKPYQTLCGWVQADGTAVEFNTLPAYSASQFAWNLNSVVKELRAMIPKSLEFSFVPTVNYRPAMWNNIPKEAKVLGCDPDYLAGRNGELNGRDIDFRGVYERMRVGGGHLHYGWGSNLDYTDKSHRWDCITLVNSLESVIGSYSMLWDRDKLRNSYYGRDAPFRPKSFGVEWRGLSNAWLGQPGIHTWLFSASKAVFDGLKNGVVPYECIGSRPWELSDHIRRCQDPYRIDDLITRFNDYFKDQLWSLKLPPLPLGSLNVERIRETEVISKQLGRYD